MYLISVDDGIYINITTFSLLIEESGNIFKSFIRTPTWSIAGKQWLAKTVRSMLD